jgi:hypothetical protein
MPLNLANGSPELKSRVAEDRLQSLEDLETFADLALRSCRRLRSPKVPEAEEEFHNKMRRYSQSPPQAEHAMIDLKCRLCISMLLRNLYYIQVTDLLHKERNYLHKQGLFDHKRIL